MSLVSRLLGGLLCLAGGYVLGYGSGVRSLLRGVTDAIGSGVNSIPFLASFLDQLSGTEWYLTIGVILFALGAALVLLGGGSRDRVSAPTRTTTVQPKNPVCKWCGASMGGSTIYCPRCGRSQT